MRVNPEYEFMNYNSEGVYHLLIQPAEVVIRRLKEYIENNVWDLISSHEMFKYANNLMSGGESARLWFHAQYAECGVEFEVITEFLKSYYQSAIPAEFRNHECFSLLDATWVTESTVLYRFTCEVPIELLESKYGINIRRMV